MTSRYWIKLYHEVLDDPKMGRLSDRIWRRAIELFLLAGDFERNGELPSIGDIAWRLRADEAELSADLRELERVGIVTKNGALHVVTNFSKRQSADSDADRAKRYRNRNTSVTTPSRHRHDTVTSRDTDIDIDKDKDIERDKEKSNATKPPKKQRITKQPANIPPALLTFRENASKFPNKATWETIAETVGETSSALTLWGNVVAGYIAMGWNPSNVAGMLEFFRRGEVPAPRNGNGNGKKQTTQTTGIISYDGLDLDQSADFEFLRYNPNDPETPGIRAALEAQGVNVSQLLQENPL